MAANVPPAPVPTNYYALLKVKSTASDDEIRVGYKKAVLAAHPDKPGGSAAKFKALQKAYETLRDAKCRKEYNDACKAQARFRNYKPPPAFEDGAVKVPAHYPLPNGTLYAFESAPDKLKCRFRSGDVLRDGDGVQGVFVGVAADGRFFWSPSHSGAAVPLNTFGSDKDIAVLFRQQTPSQANKPTHVSAKTTESQKLAAEKEREVRQALQAKQREKKLADARKALVDEEAERRQFIVKAVEKHFETFHANVATTQRVVRAREQRASAARERSASAEPQQQQQRAAAARADAVPSTPRRTAPATPRLASSSNSSFSRLTATTRVQSVANSGGVDTERDAAWTPTSTPTKPGKKVPGSPSMRFHATTPNRTGGSRAAWDAAAAPSCSTPRAAASAC